MSESLHTPEFSSSQNSRATRFASAGGSISRSLLRSARALRYTPYRKTPSHRRLHGKPIFCTFVFLIYIKVKKEKKAMSELLISSSQTENIRYFLLLRSLSVKRPNLGYVRMQFAMQVMLLMQHKR